jgi:hypothetical protein
MATTEIPLLKSSLRLSLACRIKSKSLNIFDDQSLSPYLL